jgi:uncharacterized RDD family membrane protein YckC
MSELSWYYARDERQVGPVTLDDLCNKATVGLLEPSDLVWAEGMADWVEARRVPELAAALAAKQTEEYELTPAPPPPPAAPVTAYTAPAVASPYAAGPYAPPQQTVATLGYQRYQRDEYVYPAGFWIRFVATFIDGIIMAIPNVAISAVTELLMPTATTSPMVPPGPGTPPAAPPSPEVLILVILLNVLSIVIGWLYEAMFTASSYQATPGKMVVGLKVTDVNGNPIGFGRATGRHFAKILSGCICLIGYIMAAFDDRKRALHDQICGTLVVYK